MGAKYIIGAKHLIKLLEPKEADVLNARLIKRAITEHTYDETFEQYKDRPEEAIRAINKMLRDKKIPKDYKGRPERDSHKSSSKSGDSSSDDSDGGMPIIATNLMIRDKQITAISGPKSMPEYTPISDAQVNLNLMTGSP